MLTFNIHIEKQKTLNTQQGFLTFWYYNTTLLFLKFIIKNCMTDLPKIEKNLMMF